MSGSSPAKIKAILFDMDGVLIEAKDWHYEALNKALSIFGLKISRYDHLVTYDGLPTKRKLEMLSLERGLPKALHKFINDLKQQHTINLIHNHCKPKFYHEYALSRLKQDNYKLAVCSNSVRTTVDLMIKKSELNPYLDFFLSNQDITKPKPDPEIYATAIMRLDLNPEEVLILEDNEKGIKAAEASGAHLMVIDAVEDVNYYNISNRIKSIETGEKS
jgi:HAD superfamily hydrolase (TIGR01509 family)